MPGTCIATHPIFLEHQTGPGHPESSQRLEAILEALKACEASRSLFWLTPEPSPLEAIERIHAPEYIRRVEEACTSGLPFLDSLDTGIGPRSYEAALVAAGAGLLSVQSVMEERCRTGFAAVRPPGHHAEHDRAMGFCLFNNIAIAAGYLIDHWSLKRLLILDWDVHHGNGTQSAFEQDPSVFYFSIHQYPHYPGTGQAHETGTGAGKGTTCNVPVPEGADDETYLRAFRDRLVPAASEFKPEFVLVSAGFDAHVSDPLSGTRLTTECFGELTSVAREIAETHCQGRLVSFLEGGYDCKALAESVVEHVHRLSEEVTA